MRKIIIVLVTIILLVVASYGLMLVLAGLKQPPKDIKVEEVIKAVEIKPVKYDEVNTSISGTGRIVSKEIVTLISEVSGKLLRAPVPLKKGQSFRKGQLLVRIYKEDAELNLKGLKSQFLNAIAIILPDLKIDFPDSYKAWRDFLANIELDKDLPELPKIKNEKEKIYLASKGIINQYYSIKGEEIRLKKYNIYAPFSGSYTDVNLEVGSVTSMGGRIASMINTGALEMEVPIPAETAKLIRPGSNVEAISQDGETIWQGRVSRKSNFVDPTTQSINVFVSLRPQRGKKLYRGMYLKARFNNMQFKDVMEIPRSCVYNFDEVFVVEDSIMTKKDSTDKQVEYTAHILKTRHINILMTKESTLLVNGLKEGERLVVEALVDAMDNSEVLIKD